MEISKQDWKLFRERLPQWQETYMETLLKDYLEIINEDCAASDRFWKLEKRIKEDRRHPGVIMELRKTDVLMTMARFLAEELIAPSDLEGFSEEAIEQVTFLSQRFFKD